MKKLTFMHWSGCGTPAIGGLKGGALLAGLAWALGVTLAACALMCAWVVLTLGPVYNFSTLVTVGTLFGAALGGAAGGRAAGTLGLLHGFLTGALYGLVLTAPLLAGGMEGFSAAGLAVRVALLGVAGAVGGLCGVNSRARRARRATRQRIF